MRGTEIPVPLRTPDQGLNLHRTGIIVGRRFFRPSWRQVSCQKTVLRKAALTACLIVSKLLDRLMISPISRHISYRPMLRYTVFFQFRPGLRPNHDSSEQPVLSSKAEEQQRKEGKNDPILHHGKHDSHAYDAAIPRVGINHLANCD